MLKHVFNITIHLKDEEILKLIQAYFTNCARFIDVNEEGIIGSIYKTGKDRVCFSIDSLQQISNVLIPHLNQYPLITQLRRADYLIFKEVIGMVANKEYLTREGLERIKALKAAAAYLNKGLHAIPAGIKSPKIISYYCPIVNQRPEVPDPE